LYEGKALAEGLEIKMGKGFFFKSL
jgi:hypothetical protein